MSTQTDDRACLVCSNLYTPTQEAVCGHSICNDCTQHYIINRSKCPVCKNDLVFETSTVKDDISTQGDEEVVAEEQSFEQMELLDSTSSGGKKKEKKIEFCSGDVLNLKVTIARSHFAIYAGHGRIIHYQKMLGKYTIIEETIQQFWQREGMSYRVKKAELGPIDGRMHKAFPGDEVVKRARHHLGRTNFNIIFENSEDFANWCKYGVKMSDRVEGVGVAATGGAGLASGAAAGAIIGGAAGSFFPVVGTVIGAVVGAGIGAATGGGLGALGGWGASKISRKLRKNK